MADSYDVIVIGGGPGGYVAAIRAAQLGKKTAVVELDKPGGRCLNYACIPAKTVLHSAELYDHARNGAELGVTAKGIAMDWKALGERRAKVSNTLSGGVEMLDRILPAEDKDMARVVERTFKKQNITVSTGTPVESVDTGKSSVKVKYGDTEIEVDYLCIAGGRAPDTKPLNLEAAGVKTTD